MRMLARSTIVAYIPRQPSERDYVVEHRGKHAHQAKEPCSICETYALAVKEKESDK